MARVLTSPVGDPVEILGDLRLSRAMGYDRPDNHYGGALFLSEQRYALMRVLWHHGAYEDRKSGRVMQMMADDADVPVQSMSTAVRTPVMEHLLLREANARRTHYVQLIALPERWADTVVNSSPLLAPPVPAAPVAEEGHPVPSPIPSEGGVGDGPPDFILHQGGKLTEWQVKAPAEIDGYQLQVADAVATSLLAQVVDIISHGRADGSEAERMRSEITGLMVRLGDQVEDSKKLRKQLVGLGDELLAVKRERDGLRTRLRHAEFNLSRATGADVQKVIDAEIRKGLDKVMREVPNPRESA